MARTDALTAPDDRTIMFRSHDLAIRKALAARIQAQAPSDVPFYPLGLYYNPTAYRADLTGVLSGGPLFWNVRRV